MLCLQPRLQFVCLQRDRQSASLVGNEITGQRVMSKKTRYTRLETDPESSDSEDEAPPTHMPLHNSQYVKGNCSFLFV